MDTPYLTLTLFPNWLNTEKYIFLIYKTEPIYTLANYFELLGLITQKYGFIIILWKLQ